MAEAARKPMSVEEFFVWQDRQEELYEYVDGRLIPRSMTGATQRHDRLVINAIIDLGPKLRGGPCRPMTADVAVETRNGKIRRPDLTIDCGPPSDGSLRALSPVLVLEVLSPSTAEIDVLIKVDEYKAIQSMRYILVAAPNAAHVLLYTRGEDGGWTGLDHIGLDTVLDLPGLSCSLALAALYEGVTLAATPAPA